jgi:hypothetical protein
VIEQPFGPLIDLVLQPFQGVNRVVHRWADEPVGAVTPQAELDPLAIDQDQPAIRRQGAVRDDQLQGDGLAAAGFPPMSMFRSARVTWVCWPISSVPRCTGCQIDRGAFGTFGGVMAFTSFRYSVAMDREGGRAPGPVS